MNRKTAVVALAVAVLGAVAILTVGAGDDDALVVYNGRSHYGGEAAFERFERETGIKVKLFGGDAAELYERLRSEGSGTPADVLVTVDGANLWLAQEAGLLAPMAPAQRRIVERSVPEALRDPQGRWTAVSTRVRTIVRSTERVQEADVQRLEDLGAARFRGRVCLRTSNNIYNQSLVASLLAERGERRTEALLRSWMANDPEILGSDVDVLDAIAAGRCDLGLTNHYYLARKLFEDPRFPVAPVWPDQDAEGAHANISGAGVVASSDRPAQAARLVAFLTQPESQEAIAEKGELPVNDAAPAEVDRLGGPWTEKFKTDPIDVAAAGAQQKAAVQLMARVGWE